MWFFWFLPHMLIFCLKNNVFFFPLFGPTMKDVRDDDEWWRVHEFMRPAGHPGESWSRWPRRRGRRVGGVWGYGGVGVWVEECDGQNLDFKELGWGWKIRSLWWHSFSPTAPPELACHPKEKVLSVVPPCHNGSTLVGNFNASTNIKGWRLTFKSGLKGEEIWVKGKPDVKKTAGCYFSLSSGMIVEIYKNIYLLFQFGVFLWYFFGGEGDFLRTRS